MIKAECTWGDGPDVLLSGGKAILMKPSAELDRWTNGTCGEVQIDLTLKEAKQLLSQLSSAIQEVEQLEAMCKHHDEKLEVGG